MRARKVSKIMKARKAHKKMKACTVQRHEDTQAHKAREHVKQVGTEGTQACEARSLGHSLQLFWRVLQISIFKGFKTVLF